MAVGKNYPGRDMNVDQSAGVYGEVSWSTPPSSSGAVGSPARFLDGPSWRQGPLEASTDDHATAAAGTDASLTLAAPDGRHVLYGLSYSYDAVPVSGSVRVESPSGTVIFQSHVTSSGAGEVDWDQGLSCPKGEAARVVLANGAAAKRLTIKGRGLG